MYFPAQINTIRLGVSIIHFKGLQVEISKLCCASVPEEHLYTKTNKKLKFFLHGNVEFMETLTP